MQKLLNIPHPQLPGHIPFPFPLVRYVTFKIDFYPTQPTWPCPLFFIPWSHPPANNQETQSFSTPHGHTHVPATQFTGLIFSFPMFRYVTFKIDFYPWSHPPANNQGTQSTGSLFYSHYFDTVSYTHLTLPTKRIV